MLSHSFLGEALTSQRRQSESTETKTMPASKEDQLVSARVPIPSPPGVQIDIRNFGNGSSGGTDSPPPPGAYAEAQTKIDSLDFGPHHFPSVMYLPGSLVPIQPRPSSLSLPGFPDQPDSFEGLGSIRTKSFIPIIRDTPELQRAWAVVENAIPLERIRAFYPNFADVFKNIVKILYRELKRNGYSHEFVKDLKSRQRHPENMPLDAILIEAGASPREMKEKFSSNPQEREDLEAYILLAAVLLTKNFKPDPWTEKYKTITEFLTAYPELADEYDKDALAALQLFANVMVNVLRYVHGKGNQQRLLTLVACLSEGPTHNRYITGGAQSKKTSRRVMIYRRESNTYKVSRPRRGRERGDADGEGTSFKRMRQSTEYQHSTSPRIKVQQSSIPELSPDPNTEEIPMAVATEASSTPTVPASALLPRNVVSSPAHGSTEENTDDEPTANLTPLELLYASAQSAFNSQPSESTARRSAPAPAPTAARAPHTSLSSQIPGPSRPQRSADTSRAAKSEAASEQQPQQQHAYVYGGGAIPAYPIPAYPPAEGSHLPYHPGMPIMAPYPADPRLFEEHRRRMGQYPMMPYPHPTPTDESTPSHAPQYIYAPAPLMMHYPMPHPAGAQDAAGAKAEGGVPQMQPHYLPYPPMYIMGPPMHPHMHSLVPPQLQSSDEQASTNVAEPTSQDMLHDPSQSNIDSTVTALLSLSSSK